MPPEHQTGPRIMTPFAQLTVITSTPRLFRKCPRSPSTLSTRYGNTFDERTYEFASFFFIMEIFKTTLLPMSIYGFSTTVAGILFSTTVGSLVDSTPRLPGNQSSYGAQHKILTFLGLYLI
ncbi:hypothetical protein BGZ99_008256 [Dissophora globulifera]|uniref:Solute carrier family 40 member n=1 Tax=Dissophora globulifera TaxID=979702 RepID=A0A9P6RRK3_9FUNG|nr:hypothetical protein BGZ99_008256 [Dissophora globulifera]